LKLKKIVHMPLIAMLIISMVIFVPPAMSATVIYVDDDEATIVNTANLTCTTDFYVPINVSDVSDMATFAFKLSYNTTLLDAVDVIKGPDIVPIAQQWLPDVGGVWTPIYDSAGYVWVGCIIQAGSEYTGSTTLATVKFHITFAPDRVVGTDLNVTCDLHLYDTELKNSMAAPIMHTTTDGTYIYTRPAIVPGEVTCDFDMPSTAYVNDIVTCTWTGDAGTGATITNYDWSLTGPGSWTDVGNQPVVKFECTGVGIVTVTLNATNDFGDSDVKSKDCDQREKLGPIIDLYSSTNRWCGVDTDEDKVGKGEGLPCDALSPDVNITLFAEVTYNGAPVNHVLVAFEVRWMYNLSWCEYNPDNTTWQFVNQCVTFRTGETDKTGIAKIWFRVPTPCTGQMFGKWQAWAKAKVQEVPIEDTMKFDVGYLVILCDMDIFPPYPDAFVREESCLTANITYKSISWIPRPVTFVVVIYDECDVPIGQLVVATNTEPAAYCNPSTAFVEVGCIPIPQYAYVGFGKVYASAFTTLPHLCGVAYCPEIVVDPIEITWSGA